MKKLREELNTIANDREEARLNNYDNEGYYAGLDQRNEEIRNILRSNYINILRDELPKYLKSTINICDFIDNIIGGEICAEDDCYEIAGWHCIDGNPHTIWFDADLS